MVRVRPGGVVGVGQVGVSRACPPLEEVCRHADDQARVHRVHEERQSQGDLVAPEDLDRALGEAPVVVLEVAVGGLGEVPGTVGTLPLRGISDVGLVEADHLSDRDDLRLPAGAFVTPDVGGRGAGGATPAP